MQCNIVFCLFFISITGVIKGSKVLTCYVMFSSAQRNNQDNFSIDNMDAKLCTHVIYGYYGIRPSTQEIISLDPSAEFSPGGGIIDKLVRLKDENDDLRILVSVGGSKVASNLLSSLVQSQQQRTAFIYHAINFLRRNKLDGLDFDWQYPTKNGGTNEDRDNFPTFLEELRKAFDTDGFILTVRLFGARDIIDQGYDLKRISRAVHYMNLRTYNYQTSEKMRTAIHAPYNSNNEFNMEYSLHYLIKNGAEPNKLLLGIPTSGIALLMETANSSAETDKKYLNLPTFGSFYGLITDQLGSFGYIDYCWEKSLMQPWKEFWHNESQTPYAVLGKKFISFDNEQSIKVKLKLVDTKNLGGISIYSLDSDDFRGYCNNGTFPLTKLVRNVLIGEPPPPPFNTTVVINTLS